MPEPVTPGAESDLPSVIADALGRYDEHMLAVRLQPALVAVWDIVARANHYLVEKEPWKLAKDPANRDEVASVLYAAAETLRVLAIAIAPIMPRPPRGSGSSSASTSRSTTSGCRPPAPGVGSPRARARPRASRSSLASRPTERTRCANASPLHFGVRLARIHVSREAPPIDRMWRPV